MKYLVVWKEKASVVTRNIGFIEAKSEEEAEKLIKDGYGEVIDSYDIDSYCDKILDIESIQEDPDYDAATSN